MNILKNLKWDKLLKLEKMTSSSRLTENTKGYNVLLFNLHCSLSRMKWQHISHIMWYNNGLRVGLLLNNDTFGIAWLMLQILYVLYGVLLYNIFYIFELQEISNSSKKQLI